MKVSRQAAAATFLAFLALALPWMARADNPATYNFTGRLSSGGTVTGQFTIDAAGDTMSAFHFTTPLGEINSPASTAYIYTYSPAQQPASDFVEIQILPAVTTPGLNLNFKSDISNLTSGSFYPAAFYPFMGVKSDPSQLMPPQGCFTCEEFTSGSITPSKPAAPPAKPDDAPLSSGKPSRATGRKG